MSDRGAINTPVLLLIFNRPDTTEAVFESIRSIRPSALYVAADGPRIGVDDDLWRCQEARRIATNVDWDCELTTLLRDQNLGAGRGVATAISWFFEGVEQGIILEDDCVASPSFYPFCAELLRFYRDDERVMHISGHNFQYGRRRGSASYYFSRYTHSGAWASWRRAWQHYDFNLIPEADRSHVWDAQWMLTVEHCGGVAVLPNVNLASNIGAGPDATHSKTQARYLFLPAEEMRFPLVHPKEILVDKRADTLTYYANFRNVAHLDLIWLYQLMDFIRLIPNRVGKLVRRARRLVRADHHDSE